MARTKADAGKKAGGKASRKVPVLRTTPAPKAAGVSKRKSSSGAKNSYCKRPTPKWQVPIEEFLARAGSSKESAAGAPSEVTILDDNKMELNEESACASVSGSIDKNADEGVQKKTTTSSDEEVEDCVEDAKNDKDADEGVQEETTTSSDEEVEDCVEDAKNEKDADEGVQEETITISDEEVEDGVEDAKNIQVSVNGSAGKKGIVEDADDKQC